MGWRSTLLAGSSVLTGVAGLLGEPRDWTPLMYSLFVTATLLRRTLAPTVRGFPGPPALKLWVLVGVSGCLFETLKWLSSGGAGSGIGVVTYDLLVFGTGYYLGWALAWSIVLRWYRFSAASVFLSTGCFGIAVEQDAHVLLTALSAMSGNPVAGVYLVLYVMMIYGAIMGLPYQLVADELRQPRQREHWVQYPVVLILMYLGSNALFLIMRTAVARPLGLAF